MTNSYLASATAFESGAENSVVTVLLTAAFLFFVGSFLGWCIEVLFRRIFTAKKWINPGFLTGPYLPLYGFGLVIMFFLCMIPINTGIEWLDALIMVLIIGAVMTAIEYVAGLIFIKGMKIKLWDYSKRWGNIQGIICPLFSLLWTLVGMFYYFVINKFTLDWVHWFVNNIAFSFVVGVFFGVMFVDLAHSVNLSVRIKKFATDHGIVVAYERLKESVKDNIEKMRKVRTDIKKPSFMFAFKSHKTLEQSLAEYSEQVETQKNEGNK